MQCCRAHAELDGRSGDGFAGSHERDSAQTELGGKWSWHEGSLSKEGQIFTLFRVTKLWGRSNCHLTVQQTRGAYGFFVFNDLGFDPYSSALIASVAVGIIAFPLSFVAFHLRGGYFAIGTWVIAEAARQIIIRFDNLGAGRGRSISNHTEDPLFRNLFTYRLALLILVLTLAGTFYLLRSQMGMALQSIRDNEVAARAIGVNVSRTKRIIFVIAASGGLLAGSVICLQAIGVAAPSQILSVSYSAFMIFMVLIGGIGTNEGPILGAVVYYVMDLHLSQLWLWYLVVLGLLAIVVTLYLPKAIWGELSHRFNIRVFPVDHRIVPASSRPRSQTDQLPINEEK